MQFILFVFLLLMPVDAHKFYVSLTDVAYNEASGRLEVSSKYFIDDLELALALDPKTPITMPMDESIVSIMSPYMDEHLHLTCDEREVDFFLLGYEIEDDVVWVYMESEEIPKFSSISVKASQLTELYDQQQNIVHVKNGDVLQSLFLRKEKTTGSLVFE